jgi:uncharacterized membrane protein
MAEALRILFAGETWMTYSVHVKGCDTFTTAEYEEGTRWLKGALEADGMTVTHIPNHLAPREFPSSRRELDRFDVIILSDIGSNTLLLHPDTVKLCQTTPNRLGLLQDFVADGGGLIMFGGWMSFQGIEGKAHYKGSPIEDILPITMIEGDDRVEVPEGFSPTICEPVHPVLKDVPKDWPKLLSYNRLRAKPAVAVLALRGDDVIWAAHEYKKGRTMAFAVDCAPHGAPFPYLEWKYYPVIWQRAIRWLARKL